MHKLCFFCTFSTFAQKIFGKVTYSKSMKMVLVARMIRHKLWMIYAFFIFFVQKSFLTYKFEINLTTRGPLYTCLVGASIQAVLQKFLKNVPKIHQDIDLLYISPFGKKTFWSDLGSKMVSLWSYFQVKLVRYIPPRCLDLTFLLTFQIVLLLKYFELPC